MGLFGNHARVGASAAGAYEIEKALKINDSDSAYLTRTPSSGGDRRTWTFSCWVKRGDVSGSASTHIFSRGTTAGGDWFFLYFNADGHLQPYFYESYGPQNLASESAGKMRDPAAWYHIVLRIDTTQSTQSNRMRLYINGVEDTWNNYNGLQEDYQYEVNETSEHRLGRAGHGDNFDGYLAEVHFLDGQSLDASHFGEFDSITGQWLPKKYIGGNYGTNGFYLDFSDNSGTTATTLGKDSSGQGNNWTPHNFSVAAGVGDDSVEDTPTNNYCTFNPLNKNVDSPVTYQEGNLQYTCASGNKHMRSSATMYMNSGKWYVEFTGISGYETTNGTIRHGIITVDAGRKHADSDALWYEDTNNATSVNYGSNGKTYLVAAEQATGGTTFQNDDVVAIALDLDNDKFFVSVNGTWFSNGTGTQDPANGTNPLYSGGVLTSRKGDGFEFACSGYDSKVIRANFGAQGFTYTPPAGFKALCTANLSEPTIKNPSKYFNTGIYTGTGSSHAITGLGFQPDKVVVKMRDTVDQDFQIFDAVRGVNKVLRWNTQESEGTQTTRLTSFDSDGFTLGTENITNQSGKSFVYWAWKESATAGFDMVKYTGNGSSPRTVSHSLGVVPELYIIKNMETNSTRWIVGNKSMDADENMFVNSVDDDENLNNFWASTRPTSSVFTVDDGDEVNKNGEEHIAYLWSSVKGFSKVGQYSGNNNNDGFFLYLGFRPAFFLVKNTNDNAAWMLYDDARGANDNNPYIVPSGYNNMVELTDIDLDINSNGIKFRYNHNNVNFEEDGAGYIYLAMARSPLKYARAK